MKVKQRTHYACIYEDDEIVEQVVGSISTYDESGNLIESKSFSPEGDVIHIETHTYENGKVVHTLQEDLVNDATQKSECEYQDDDILAQRDYFSDTDYIETRYEYNADRKVTAIRKIDNEGISHGYTTYEYTDDRTIEVEYDEDGQEVTTREYRTDAHDNIIELRHTRFLGKDTIVTQEITTYHDKDHFSEIKRYRESGLIFEAQNTFDEQGRRTSVTARDYLNPKESGQTFEYDENNRLISEEYVENGHVMQVHEITYDEHGEIIEESYHQRLYEDYFQPMTNRFEIEYFS
jgi:antitoxin component YwqK of YwqJK toxin-antitoxin module